MNDLIKQKFPIVDHQPFVPSNPEADAAMRRREAKRYVIEKNPKRMEHRDLEGQGGDTDDEE